MKKNKTNAKDTCDIQMIRFSFIFVKFIAYIFILFIVLKTSIIVKRWTVKFLTI